MVLHAQGLLYTGWGGGRVWHTLENCEEIYPLRFMDRFALSILFTEYLMN